jgi:alpha-beta hydrolase superfamily lysophospholipase
LAASTAFDLVERIHHVVDKLAAPGFVAVISAHGGEGKSLLGI